MRDKHILVAEDEEHIRGSLNVALRMAGYDVSLVGDGSKALELLEKDRSVDMLLTDIQMPEMNGLELLRNIKKKRLTLPVIVFSGYGDKVTVLELLREGCRDYLDKPFTENELLQKVDNAFNLSQVEDEKNNRLYLEYKKLQHKYREYKDSFEALSGTVDSIVHAYHKIVDTPHTSNNFKIAYESLSVQDVASDFSAAHDFPGGTDLFVADIGAHDFGASYYAAMLKSFFEENCRLGHTGEDLLHVLNWQLIHTGHNQNMVTGIHLRLDLREMFCEAVSAAHPCLFILKADNSALIRPFSLSHSGSVLGLMEKASFEKRSFAIAPGDRLVLYTDGVSGMSKSNLQTGRRERLGDLGVRDILKKNIRYPLDIFVKRSFSDIKAFNKGKPVDDALLLAVQIPE